jgi:hypothetical protein
MRLIKPVALFVVLLCCAAARAGVVINEIFYHAPNSLEDVQWIELYNTADQPTDLSNWTLDKGRLFTFPQGTNIAAHGYLVVARNVDSFRLHYRLAAVGPLKEPLKKSGARIQLLDAQGNQADVIQYKDRRPWPISADGYSTSLERICPTAPGDIPENWAASPFPPASPKPMGTPGKQNATFSATLPPIIANVIGATNDAAADEPLPVDADVKDTGLKEVSLIYRIVTKGMEGPESTLPMTKDPATGHFRAAIPGQNANTLVRYRIKAINDAGTQRLYPADNDLRPTLSVYVHDKWPASQIPLGFIIHVRPAQPNPAAPGQRRTGGIMNRFFGGGNDGPGPREQHPPRGTSAFVYVDQKTGKTTLFDYVNVVPRDNNRGYKVHFDKDQTLNGMSVVSIIFEGSERFLLHEALAYDVYRRAGNAACLTDFMRLSVDGRMVGYHLMIEQPNSAFLRRNNVHDGGNMYKIRWFGNGIVGQHDKKTNTQTGHDDLLAVVQKLQNTRGDEQWQVIQDNFNVNEVATYFAVNMVLSHWDGYFNNYYCYDDIKGTKKWEIYPWDQDKTWGYHDGIGDNIFFDMPLTFGMEGDRPPGGGGGGFFGGGFNAGGWWRPGGYFSRPLLANPQFRKIFIKRVKELLDTVYTKENYFPLIDETAARLKEDVALRAKANGSDPQWGLQSLDRHVELLKTHLLKRREFLLAQEELKNPDKGPIVAPNNPAAPTRVRRAAQPPPIIP